MSYNIGAKIGLDGEAEFRQAIRSSNDQLKVLGSEMKVVAAQFDRNDKSTEALTARNEALNKQLEVHREKLRLQHDQYDKQASALKSLADNVASATEKYGANSDEAAKANREYDAQAKHLDKLKIEMNTTTAQIAGMERQVASNTAELEDNAKGSKEAGSNVADAGEKAEKAGKDADKGSAGWAVLGAGLVKVGEVAAKAVAALGAAAAAAGTALVAASVSGAQYADDVMTMAQVLGMTTEELQELKYMEELVDVSTETMAKALTRNVKSMGDVARGSKTAAEAYGKLGVAVTDSDGSLRNANDVFYEAIDALGQVSNETERDAIAMQLFGKSARDLVPLIEAGGDELQALRQKAHDVGYVMSGETLEAFGEFDDQLQFLKVGAEGAKNALGTLLLPMLTQLAGEGVDLLGQFTRGIRDADGDVGKMATVVADMIPQVVDTIMSLLPTLLDAGMQIIGALAQGLLDNLPLIIDSAISILGALVEGIVDALPQIVDGAILLLTTLVDALIEHLPTLVDAALFLVMALAEGLVEFLPELIPAVVELVLKIVDSLLDNIDMLIDVAIDLVLALADGILKALPILIEKAPVIINKLIDAIVENLPKIIKMGFQLIGTLVTGIVRSLPDLADAAKSIVNKIVSVAGELWEKVKDIGSNIVRGIWDGISAMGDWIKEKVSGFFGGIVNSVKGLLGIKSPSRVFAGIGENMAEGLGVGFAAEMQDVGKRIGDSIPTDFDVTATTRIATARMGEGLVNGLAPMMAGTTGQPQIIQLVVGGRELARVVLDPLKELLTQRGEALA